MVAAVHRQAAPALAGERFLDFLERGCRPQHGGNEHQDHQQQDARDGPRSRRSMTGQSAMTSPPARRGNSAGARTGARLGQMVTAVPNANTTPPHHRNPTSGLRYAWMVAILVLLSYAPNTRYRSAPRVERIAPRWSAALASCRSVSRGAAYRPVVRPETRPWSPPRWRCAVTRCPRPRRTVTCTRPTRRTHPA